MRGVRYYWKDQNRFGSQAEIGFIAQEVYKVLPEVVQTDGEYWSLNTSNILGVVVEAMKEQQQLIEELKKQNMTLQSKAEKVDELEGQYKDLREYVKNLESYVKGSTKK